MSIRSSFNNFLLLFQKENTCFLLLINWEGFKKTHTCSFGLRDFFWRLSCAVIVAGAVSSELWWFVRPWKKERNPLSLSGFRPQFSLFFLPVRRTKARALAWNEPTLDRKSKLDLAYFFFNTTARTLPAVHVRRIATGFLRFTDLPTLMQIFSFDRNFSIYMLT